jgi:hypothetical protein
MKRIDLDYGKNRHASGWMLLSFGIFLSAITAGSYLSLVDDVGRWESATGPSTASIKVDSAGIRSDSEATRLQREVDEANSVIRRLSMPWNELFRAIEDSAIDKIALLSVQPDSNQRILNLSGEAQAYDDVLTYVERLDASGALAKARLVTHEVKAGDPQHPVAFAVTARWRVAP